VRLLDAAEMQRVLDKFQSYGKPDAPDMGLHFAGANP